MQKEEAVYSDEFNRDTEGAVQRDKRKAFYKKRSTLIRKYSKLLLEKKIGYKQFIITMANVDNDVLFAEKSISLHDEEIKLTIDTDLMIGEEFQFNELANNTSLLSNEAETPVDEFTGNAEHSESPQFQEDRNLRLRNCTVTLDRLPQGAQSVATPTRTQSNSNRRGMELLKDHFLRIYLENNCGIFSVNRRLEGVNAANKRVRDELENEPRNARKKRGRTGLRY